MDELIEQPTRRRIYDTVGRFPGASAREVQREAGLGWGETAYHLDQLTRAGVLRRERGGRRDYYFRPDMTWDDRKILQALRSETERGILVLLLDTPRLTLAELRERLEVSLSTSSLHLRHLIATGVVTPSRDGNVRRYSATHPERLRDLLREYRETFRDRLVDRFADTWSSLMR